MRTKTTIGLWFLGSILGGMACAAGALTPPVAEQVDRPIYYGSADSNPAVVAITNGPGYGFFCTGTLITQNVVLTASHCIEGQNTSTIQVMFGDTVGSSGTYIQSSEVLMHPSYDSVNIENDVALIRLASPAPANITPIPHLPASLALTAADEGSTIEISGFGQTEYGGSGTKMHTFISLSRVCPGPSGCSFGSGYAVPHSIGYPRSPGGTCYGDSGGPAFIERGGQTYVVGITSYGDPNCTVWGVSTKVDDFQTFINDFIGGVVPEDCAVTGDEDGDGLADCADPDCALYPDCLGPDACEQAAALGCGAQISHTTVGGESQFLSYSCLTSSTEQGPEVAYEITAPAGTQATASLQNQGSGDLDLFLVPADSGASCDPGACLSGSWNSGTQSESLTFTVPATGAFLVVETWDSPGPFTLSLSCSGGTPTPELCTNNNDDDGDGLVDCADPDCAQDPACNQVPGTEQCANAVDDDGDGLVDCADWDCAQDPACAQIPGAEQCANAADDDGDGLVDCADPDCAQEPACKPAPTPEQCANAVDDDGDGLVDCADWDCVGDPACAVNDPQASDPPEGDPVNTPEGDAPPRPDNGTGIACNQGGSAPGRPGLPLCLGLVLAVVLGWGRPRARRRRR